MKNLFSIVIAGLLGVMALSTLLRGEEFTEEQSIKAAQEGLQKSAAFPWYDAEKDTLRDVHANQHGTDDSDTRGKGWQATAKPTKNPTIPTPPTTPGWSLGSFFSGSVQTFAIVVLVALLIVLTVVLVRYFLKEEELVLGAGQAKLTADERVLDAARVENLPFQVASSQGDPLSEARRCYEAGQYGEAIVYLFAYELLQLDRHQIIHLAKGKTNRQYLREVRRDVPLRSFVERTMIAFEDVFFGQHPLPRERFEACWQGLEEFHRSLKQGAVA